jgi:hypothetical protein
LQKFLGRFAEHAKGLMNHLLPTYAPALEWGRTSYRPVQISNRATSARKDDRRLHVDAFPASPNGGKRIIRVFSNINPKNEGRVWRVGEAFETVAKTFLPRVKKPFPGKAQLLKTLRITKQFRSLYDHYMLQMHDRMKMDGDYQKRAQQTEVHFPAGCSWIVQTDQVSHAALKGQYVLEQTFYLPVEAMVDPGRSPLRVLEGLLGRELV